MLHTALALAPLLLVHPTASQDTGPTDTPATAAPVELDAGTWRYETGRRMRAMERAWAAASEERRAAAVETIDGSVALFFRADMAGVARELDAARRLLVERDAEPSDVERAADALAIVPSTRLVAAGTERIELRFASLYGASDVLDDATITLRTSDPGTGSERIVGRAGEGVDGPFPLDLDGWSADRFLLRGELEVDGEVVPLAPLRLEIVADLDARLAALKEQVGRRSKLADTIAAYTAHQYLGLLEDLVDGATLETDYPAGELLERAEFLADAQAEHEGDGEPSAAAAWIGAAGERWLALPLAKGTSNVRLFVPSGIEPGERAPLVLALHGAGGSQNLFFDGYGDGLAVDLARERGWILVAPQVGFLGCPAAEIVDALAAHVPIDTDRVFVVGHSMGAAATIGAAAKTPDRFRAIAALGGGGDATEAVAAIPVYLAAGASDFGKRGVDALAARLEGFGAANLVHRTYENTEHLLIVQRALPDVFAFFDLFEAAVPGASASDEQD
ncbi:Alpha/beta hydrolase family protein [Planctomycetes bacterium Pla163]|uniref:Alpha/beta hydrolase family protein n=1 Tax=Rohdeia mirabilis TaxID=2528008 RepID=A0A518D3D8_9BACT|nr:Alpha/beta hydrolase family protein [Planctomycetes bacterium Pla163]